MSYKVNVIYYKTHCPYSQRALQLLDDNKIPLKKIEVSNDHVGHWKKYILSHFGTTVTTVPQIIINGVLIGGCTDFESYLHRYKQNLHGGTDVNSNECTIL